VSKNKRSRAHQDVLRLRSAFQDLLLNDVERFVGDGGGFSLKQCLGRDHFRRSKDLICGSHVDHTLRKCLHRLCSFEALQTEMVTNQQAFPLFIQFLLLIDTVMSKECRRRTTTSIPLPRMSRCTKVHPWTSKVP
jgi:hypothetical protein